MDRVLKVTQSNFCRYRFLQQQLCWNVSKETELKFLPLIGFLKNRFYSSHNVLNNNCLHKDLSNYSLLTQSKLSLLNCSRGRVPPHFHVCNFHLNSVHFTKRKGIRKRLNLGSAGESFENANWNLASDPGRGELLEEIQKEGKGSKSETAVFAQDTSVETEYNVIKSETSNSTVPVEIEDFTVEETQEDSIDEWVPPIELKRGRKGVFDIEELVTLLKTENAKDICVVRLPDAFTLADYMVIVSGLSYRHCRAITTTVQWMFKRKRNKKDFNLKIEGLENSKDWIAIDLGNIFLHVFSSDARELYDLESLWTLGEKYDDRSQNVEDPFSINQSDLDWLQQLDVNKT